MARGGQPTLRNTLKLPSVLAGRQSTDLVGRPCGSARGAMPPKRPMRLGPHRRQVSVRSVGFSPSAPPTACPAQRERRRNSPKGVSPRDCSLAANTRRSFVICRAATDHKGSVGSVSREEWGVSQGEFSLILIGTPEESINLREYLEKTQKRRGTLFR